MSDDQPVHPLRKLSQDIAALQERAKALPKHIPDNPAGMKGYMLNWVSPVILNATRLLAETFNVALEGFSVAQGAQNAAMQINTAEALQEIAGIVDLLDSSDDEQATLVMGIRMALSKAGFYELDSDAFAEFEAQTGDGAEGPELTVVSSDAEPATAEPATAEPATQVIEAEAAPETAAAPAVEPPPA